jgi:hypothetical protein
MRASVSARIKTSIPSSTGSTSQNEATICQRLFASRDHGRGGGTERREWNVPKDLRRVASTLHDATRHERDKFSRHAISPGESRHFQSCLQLKAAASLAGRGQGLIKFFWCNIVSIRPAHAIR